MNFKTAFLFFSTGIILGIALSPIATKPQNILQAIPHSYAIENSEIDLIIAPSSSSFSLENYLAYFDNHQPIIPSPTPKPVLSAKTALNNININPINQSVKNVTISFFGDSMIDTMETNTPYFAEQIKKYYPNFNFTLLNYGIGAQQVDKGFARIEENFSYKDRNYSPILKTQPDVIILDSFAYNPYDNLDSDLEKYKTELNQLINKLQSTGSQVIFLATIAPLKVKFGAGPGGVNWPSDLAYTHATKIQSYMEVAISIAKQNNLPIIDLYHLTLQTNGEGIAKLVSSHDGIHPSAKGHEFIASQISEFIAKNRLL